MDASFALFQIHRITRKIPVNDRMAVGMEIQAFLADGSSRQNEWPEWRIEGGTHRFFAKLRFFSLATALIAIAHCKAHPGTLIIDGQASTA